MITVDLSRPIEWEGETFKRLAFDIGSLTGRDLQAILRHLRKTGVRDVAMPETDERYLMAVAAKAGNVDVEMLEALPARDYTAVKMETQGFLLGSDSGPTPSES